MNILVTGGAGYIGSHTCVALTEAGHRAVVLDNLSNASPEALRRVEAITGSHIDLIRGDIRNRPDLDRALDGRDFDCCIHFAGLKAVGESVSKPLEYYENNVAGTLKLLEALRDHGCKNLIFSSSATVYGDPAEIPITENCPKGQCTNPYGWTKSMQEQMLADLVTADRLNGAADPWNIVLLRYFNPIGAHPSGRIGEDPRGIPNNLMPYITQVAAGRLEQLSVYGDDYPTTDGTGVRDYIHVMDLAEGHVSALEAIRRRCGLAVYNLGTGRGYSVLEVVHAFERASGVIIPYAVRPRRPGDVAECWSSPEKAARELGWRAKRGLDEMCRDSWNWQRQNPEGYRT